MSVDLSTGRSGRGIFSLEVSTSQMILVCVDRKLTSQGGQGRKKKINYRKMYPKPQWENQIIKYLASMLNREKYEGKKSDHDLTSRMKVTPPQNLEI